MKRNRRGAHSISATLRRRGIWQASAYEPTWREQVRIHWPINGYR